MKKLNQNGFSAFELILLVLVLAALGFSGYLVHQKNAPNEVPFTADVEKSKSTDKQAKPESISLSIKQNWYKYTSPDAKFSIKLPNGTNFITAEESIFLFTRQPIPSDNSIQATLSKQEGGSDNPTGLFVSYMDNINLNKRGDKMDPITSYAGDVIEHYKYVQKQDPDGIDIPKGATSNHFILTKGNKVVTVMYNTLSEANIEYILEMVKTIEVS